MNYYKTASVIAMSLQLAASAAVYTSVVSGSPPCADNPWMSHEIYQDNGGYKIDLNIVNIDPGTFVSRWYASIPQAAADSLEVVSWPPNIIPGSIEVETGTFHMVGRTFNLEVTFETANLGERFEYGTVTFATTEPVQVSGNAMAHLQGQDECSECGNDSVWIGLAPPPTPATLLSAAFNQKQRVVSWVTGVEFGTIGFRVTAFGTSGKSWSKIVPAKGIQTRAEYSVQCPAWTRMTTIEAIDLRGLTTSIFTSLETQPTVASRKPTPETR
jgi:hypothetical protein